ncbi:MAG: molecular chaperone DnaJ [Bacteroidota bacterium]|nr:molecular chaperone DnaJ [Bacteroidota bacterium]
MMPSSIKYYLLLFFLAINFYVVGQGSINDHKIEHYMKEARQYMEEGNYEEANLSFRKLLAINSVMPTEMCYFFAETLYQLHQYQNSKNFINKYIKLTGTTGPYYKKIIALDKLVDEKFEEIKSCNFCDNKGYRFTECDKCYGEGELHQTCHYCKGKGLTSCIACGGKGVKISENNFKEKEYKTCQVCGSNGVVTCTVCNGTKNEVIQCNKCKGNGAIITNKICNHPPQSSSTIYGEIGPEN